MLLFLASLLQPGYHLDHGNMKEGKLLEGVTICMEIRIVRSLLLAMIVSMLTWKNCSCCSLGWR